MREEVSKRRGKYYVRDVLRPTPQLLVEHARRDLVEAQDALRRAREYETESRRDMDTKWQQLRDKQLILRQSFISFDKFVRENEEKRSRAECKMRDDASRLARGSEETVAMRGRMDEMEQIRHLVEGQVRQYSVYEEYLMSVVKAYPEFTQPLDILNRYEALAGARTELATKQERDLESLERSRREMAILADDKRRLVMPLNSTLASLRWRYDAARAGSVRWEQALVRLKQTVTARSTELAHTRSAIWTLYLNICQHKGTDVSAKQEDFESQLVVIMRSLLESRRIVEAARARTEKTSTQLQLHVS